MQVLFTCALIYWFRSIQKALVSWISSILFHWSVIIQYHCSYRALRKILRMRQSLLIEKPAKYAEKNIVRLLSLVKTIWGIRYLSLWTLVVAALSPASTQSAGPPSASSSVPLFSTRWEHECRLAAMIARKCLNNNDVIIHFNVIYIYIKKWGSNACTPNIYFFSIEKTLICTCPTMLNINFFSFWKFKRRIPWNMKELIFHYNICFSDKFFAKKTHKISFYLTCPGRGPSPLRRRAWVRRNEVRYARCWPNTFKNIHIISSYIIIIDHSSSIMH